MSRQVNSKRSSEIATPSGDGRTLPQGWKTVRFGDVVRDVNEAERNPFHAGLERFVGLEHIEPENLHLTKWGNLADGDISFTKRFRKGQVLFGKRRAYQRKVAVAEFDGICSSDILTFEPKDDSLIPDLLPFIVQSDGFFQHALGTSSGSLSPRTRWSQLQDYEFPLPPKDEQLRIADILWAADETLELYSTAMTAADQFHRLTIADSLKAAQAFPTVRLVSVISATRPLCYGIVQPGSFDPNGVPFVRVCDMEGGQIAIDSLEKVEKSVSDQYRRSVIREGDVLVSIVGTIGRVAQVTKDANGFNIARAVARIAPGPDVMSDFLLFVLRSDQLQRSLVGESFETARKTLNLGALGDLLIPLPPLEVQCQLVSRVSASQSACDRVRDHLDVLKITNGTLRDSFLAARTSAHV